ncbi:hypothetical protein ACLOJK_019607 [Asimina triloba]
MDVGAWLDRVELLAGFGQGISFAGFVDVKIALLMGRSWLWWLKACCGAAGLPSDLDLEGKSSFRNSLWRMDHLGMLLDSGKMEWVAWFVHVEEAVRMGF